MTKERKQQKKEHTHTPRSKQNINLQESSRLKANSEVNYILSVFSFFSHCFFFSFFFLSLSKRAQSKPNKTKKRCREDIYIQLSFGDSGQKAYIRQQGFPFIFDSGGIVFYLINVFQIKQKVV